MPEPPLPPKLPETPCDKTNINNGSNLLQWEKITLTSAKEEIEKLIARNKLNDAEITFFCQVKPILQDGPQCGLVALAMASQEFSKPVSVTQLLTEARVRGFTQHGELYSVDFMNTLATKHLPNHRPEILTNLQNCPDTIAHVLLHGAMILIPYDADFNHAPCLKQGHKAHWALLVGLINSRQGCYALARHGKSRHLACWPLCDLLESNGNLVEEGEARHAGGYIIPQGGIGGQQGLKSRALALYPCS